MLFWLRERPLETAPQSEEMEMPSVTFTQPPTSQKNATLYQHAKETLRFGKEVHDALAAMDNQDGVDMNSNAGTVITSRPQAFKGVYKLTGALSSSVDTGTVGGQLVDGKLDARVGSGNPGTRVTYQDTPEKTEASVEARAQSHYKYHPGTLKVTQDKATGTIEIQQETDFPWELEYVGCIPEQEVLFAPSGPSDQSQVGFYQQGQRFQAAMEAEMKKMKAMDNGPDDLNPEPGLVVAAGLGTQDSDNLVYGHMAGDYRIPTEAMIRFDPSTGLVQEFTRGFGDHNTLSFRREGDTQIFERNAFLNCDRLELRPDGSRFQQHLQDAKLVGKAQLYEKEHKVTTSLLPRLLDSRNALAVGGWSAGLGLAAGLLSATAGPAVAITVGMAAAAVTAGVSAAAKMHPVELDFGVNRFSGSNDRERMAQAQKAMKSFEESGYRRGRKMEMGAEGVNREQCRNFLAASDTGYGGENLLILCDRLGEKGQPALVVVGKDFHYPIKLQEQGLELPGGLLVDYASIKAMTDLS